MKVKPPKPWLAGLLTIFKIGLGHLYCGRIKRGVTLFLGGQLLYIFGTFSFLFYAPLGIGLAIITLVIYTVYCIADSVRCANSYKLSYPIKKYNKWYFYLLYWFVASFIIHLNVATAVKNNIAEIYKIPSGAMKQTIQIGDHIIAAKYKYKISEPKRGEIVIFPFPENPSKDFIKRVIGLGGETLEIIDKEIFINGKVLNESYITHSEEYILPKDSQPRDNFGPVTIPEDSVFVMGDNRDQSYDSRFWGFVKKSSIKGKALSIYWSWDKDAFKVRWSRIGKTLK